MNDQQKSFANQISLAALQAGTEPWKARWISAIACHESGFGSAIPHDTETGENSFNPFGYMVPDNVDWPFVQCREAGTRLVKRFRKFSDYVDACTKILYLIEKSRIAGHTLARAHYADYVRTHGEDSDTARRNWMLEFSQSYCPVDPHHGPAVVAIFDLIGPVVAGQKAVTL